MSGGRAREGSKRKKRTASGRVKNVKTIKSDDDKPGLTRNAAGEEEWIVERIVARRHTAKGLRYEVKWAGWKKKYNTLEPLCNLKNCMELVRQFEATVKKFGIPWERNIRIAMGLQGGPNSSQRDAT